MMTPIVNASHLMEEMMENGQCTGMAKAVAFLRGPQCPPSLHTRRVPSAVLFPNIKPQLCMARSVQYFHFVMEKDVEGFHLGEKIEDKLACVHQ